MNSFRCIIADDNELDRLTIAEYLVHFPEIDIINIFENSLEALSAIENEKPDIIFLDVDMPGISGLELRKKVSQIPICIFTTDHPEYAVESFELETLDYLLKPYSLARFSQTVERIKEYMGVQEKASRFESLSENYIFIKVGYKKVKIFLDDILYLNSLQNYTVIFTREEKQYVLSTFSSLLSDKNFASFVRVHKSYAVNVKHITALTAKEIILSEGTRIPLGRSYKSSIENILIKKYK